MQGDLTKPFGMKFRRKKICILQKFRLLWTMMKIFDINQIIRFLCLNRDV